MTQSDVRKPDRVLLERGLGVSSIVFMVIAAAAPMAVTIGIFPLIFSSGGSPGAPLFYIVAGVVLLLFSVGFTTMSKYVHNAGAFYTYVQLGLGRMPGSGAALLALLSYTVLLISNYIYIGFATTTVFDKYADAELLPWWGWSLIVAVLVGLLGYRDIELSARVLALLLAAEILSVVVTDILIIIKDGHAGLSITPLLPENLTMGSPALGMMFAFLSFVGFEATAVFRNEAKSPDTTIPRATYIAVISIGVFYAISSWCTAIGIGSDGVVDTASHDPANLFLNLAQQYVHPILHDVMQVVLIGSFFAAALSAHNISARYVFTMGEKRLLPSKFGNVSVKHRAPSRASLAVTVVSLVFVLITAFSGLDPLTSIFAWLSGAGTLGLVALMAITSLSILVFFRRTEHDRRVWHTLVAPGIACACLSVLLLLVILNFPLLVGNLPAAVGTGCFVGASFVAGVVIALQMRSRRHDAYTALIEPNAESDR